MISLPLIIPYFADCGSHRPVMPERTYRCHTPDSSLVQWLTENKEIN